MVEYNNSSNMQRRRQFRVEPLKGEQLRYEGLVDRHLEQTLVKTKLVNRRNEIIDRTVCKVIEGEHLQIHNSFRLKKSSSKKRYASVKSRAPSMTKTVGKKEFEEFLEQQRRQIKENMPRGQEEAIKTLQSQVLPRAQKMQ